MCPLSASLALMATAIECPRGGSHSRAVVSPENMHRGERVCDAKRKNHTGEGGHLSEYGGAARTSVCPEKLVWSPGPFHSLILDLCFLNISACFGDGLLSIGFWKANRGARGYEEFQRAS